MSEWYRRELKNFNEYCESQHKQTPYAFLGVTIFFAACIIFMIIHGHSDPTYNTGASVGIVGGAYVFILLIMLLSAKISKKRVGLPTLEADLKKLLTTPEMIEEFDAEMLSEPLWKSEQSDDLRITEHYLINIFGPKSQKCYSFARLEDIDYTDRCVTRDNAKVLGLGRIYDNDMCASDGTVIMGITIRGKKLEDDFEEHLAKYAPNIRIRP